MGDENTPEQQQQQQQPQEDNKNKIQKRMNQLYGQKKEAEEMADTLKQENEQLRSQMQDFQEQLKLLKEQKPAAPDVGTPGNQNFGGVDPEQIQGMIRQTVGEAVSEQLKTQQQQQALGQAQRLSWNAAVKEFGEGFKDTNSELYQTAQNIWASDPILKQDPKGPYKAAVMARGLLGDIQNTPGQGMVPAQQSINQNISKSDAEAELQEIDKELDALNPRLMKPTGGSIGSDWMRHKALQVKKGELLKKLGKK